MRGRLLNTKLIKGGVGCWTLNCGKKLGGKEEKGPEAKKGSLFWLCIGAGQQTTSNRIIPSTRQANHLNTISALSINLSIAAKGPESPTTLWSEAIAEYQGKSVSTIIWRQLSKKIRTGWACYFLISHFCVDASQSFRNCSLAKYPRSPRQKRKNNLSLVIPGEAAAMLSLRQLNVGNIHSPNW